jgi:DNA-binding transcriptional LysR family regulator
MPLALRSFRDEYPGVEVVLSAVDDSAGADGLRKGRFDLAFINNPEPDDVIEAVPMLEDPWVILTRRDSAIAELRRPGFDVLEGADLVAWTHRWQGQRELEQAWARRGIAPRIVYRTDDNLALQRLVAAGLGHACIGRLAARRAVDPSLTWLSPRDLLSHREIALCYPRQRQMTATARALVAASAGRPSFDTLATSAGGGLPQAPAASSVGTKAVLVAAIRAELEDHMPDLPAM